MVLGYKVKTQIFSYLKVKVSKKGHYFGLSKVKVKKVRMCMFRNYVHILLSTMTWSFHLILLEVSCDMIT